ncbi:hypothetical protein QYF36_005758 [Acer negundo]|nr:hypothetical protein QYF36_005758 [Acer negundo]
MRLMATESDNETMAARRQEAQEQHYRHFEQLPPQPQTSPLIIICSNGLYLAVRSNFNHERPLHVFDFASNSLKFRFTMKRCRFCLTVIIPTGTSR